MVSQCGRAVQLSLITHEQFTLSCASGPTGRCAGRTLRAHERRSPGFSRPARERYAGSEAAQAAMTSLDRLGFQVRLSTSEGVRGARIAFLREVSSPAEPDAFLSRWLNRRGKSE